MVEPVEHTIKKFILENFLFTSDPGRIADTTSFLDGGIVDSTGILEIINFVEETYGIKVEDREIAPENLDSIARLTSFVQRKTAASGPDGTQA